MGTGSADDSEREELIELRRAVDAFGRLTVALREARGTVALAEAVARVGAEVVGDVCTVELAAAGGRAQLQVVEPPADARSPAGDGVVPIVEPLVGPRDVIGRIELARGRPGAAPYTPADQRLAREIAGRAALVLASAREREDLVVERRRLETILGQLPSAVTIVDGAGVVVMANERTAAILGHPIEPGVIEGRDASGALVRDDGWPIHRALRGETVAGEEIEIVRRDRTRAHVRVSAAPLRDDDGRTTGAIAVYDDVTRERAAELARRAGEERLRLVTDALPVMVSYVDAEERYGFVNRAYEAWFGVARADLLGRRIGDVVDPRAQEELRPHVVAALAGVGGTYEHTVRHRSLGARTVRVDYVPQRDAAGHVDGFVVLGVDVTEQRRAEDRMRFLAEASKLLATSLDYETTLKSVCALAVPRLADWAAIEMVGDDDGPSEQLAVAHVDPAKVEVAWEYRRRFPTRRDAPTGVPNVIRTGRSEIYEDIPDELLVATIDDPEHLRVARELGLRSVIVVAITTRRGTIGAITLVQAESDRRFNEADLRLAEELAARAALAIENATLYREAQAAVRLRDDFLSIAGHELRTPLAALSLQIENLRRRAGGGAPEGGAAKMGERLDKAVGHVGRLERLVSELLDVSRISDGRLAIRREPVDLVALVREVGDRFAEQLARAGSRLTIDAPPSLGGEWDRLRLDQVLTNLLANAVKYGAGEPIEVRVEEGQGGAVARLEVRDHGIGISPADQERVFGRFERAVSERNYGGMGLGLWISRQIVQALGGTIRVESRRDEGARFIVELPRRSA